MNTNDSELKLGLSTLSNIIIDCSELTKVTKKEENNFFKGRKQFYFTVNYTLEMIL